MKKKQFMQAGKPLPLTYTKRHGRFAAQHAVRDVYDALVELITNSDDSYHRMDNNPGDILIEIERKQKELSSIIVRDRAEGMTIEEMGEKIRKVGNKTSKIGDRSFMGRGAKDCATLGKITFESIKNGQYHKCEVLPSMDFIPYQPSIQASAEIRSDLSIPKGNGTVVTINVEQSFRIPRHETLLSDLKWHYALRDILNKKYGRKIQLRNLNDSKLDRLAFEPPEGEIVVDEPFYVPGYIDSQAHITIVKSKVLLEDPVDKKFRRTGIIIKGKRAIHEVSLLVPEFERDRHAQYYYGKLECPIIDDLCEDYDNKQACNQPLMANNPFLLIDPNRQAGIRRDHPFTKALFKRPIILLRELIEKDSKQEKKKYIKIANEETRKKLDRLARAASKFMKEKCEEIEDFAFSGREVSQEFTKIGAIIIPNIYIFALDEVKTFGFRVKRTEDLEEGISCEIESTSRDIKILTPMFPLSVSPSDHGILTGNFKIQGIHVTDEATLQVKCGNLRPIEALLSVQKEKVSDIEIPNGFAFERDIYRIKDSKKKRLLIWAKYPEVVDRETQIATKSDCQDVVIVKPQGNLIPVIGSNYAEGYITVQGRKVGAKGQITASANGLTTVTSIVVVSKETRGIPLKIDFTEKDIGSFRAMWDWPHNPNNLLISAIHPSLKRYLGPPPSFIGQDDPHFRLLIAEIVSENIVYRILEQEEKSMPWEYEGMNVQQFYAKHNKHMKEFLPLAHDILLSLEELESIKYKSTVK